MDKKLNFLTIGLVVIAIIIGVVVIMSLKGLRQEIAQTNQPIGGSTAGDWNVGGNLSITGTSALSGSNTFSGTTTNSTNQASTTLVSTIGAFERLEDSSIAPADGLGMKLVFSIEDEGSNGAVAGSGSATTTSETHFVLDDTATTSIESSIELWQKLDDDYTLTKILDIDSGAWLFDLDYSTTTDMTPELARWTRWADTDVDLGSGENGIGGMLSFYTEYALSTSTQSYATSTNAFVWTMDDTSSSSPATSFQIHQKLDGEFTLTNVFELDSGDMIVNTDTLFVDRSADSVGIGTTTPFGSLSVEIDKDMIPFWIGDNGSSTPSLAIDLDGGLMIGTSTLTDANVNIGVGIANATTTIEAPKLCIVTQLEDGTNMYMWPCSNSTCEKYTGANINAAWATSTTPCNDDVGN